MAPHPSTKRMAEWFRQWRMPLRKFLHGRGGLAAADVDDVAQEVFLRLLRYDRTELVGQPQAYLFKVATNVAAEWAIRARNRRPHDSKWLEALTSETQPEGLALRASTHDAVQRAINKLTARQREILKMTFSDDLAQAQIAKRLGATPRSVRRTLAKSYEKLRNELDRELLGMATYDVE